MFMIDWVYSWLGYVNVHNNITTPSLFMRNPYYWFHLLIWTLNKGNNKYVKHLVHMLNTLTLPKTFEFLHKCPLLSLINNLNFVKTHILHIEIPRVICYFTLTHIDNTKTTQVLVKTLVILEVSLFSWTSPIKITWLHSLVGLQKTKQKILYLLQNILIPTPNILISCTHQNNEKS